MAIETVSAMTNSQAWAFVGSWAKKSTEDDCIIAALDGFASHKVQLDMEILETLLQRHNSILKRHVLSYVEKLEDPNYLPLVEGLTANEDVQLAQQAKAVIRSLKR